MRTILAAFLLGTALSAGAQDATLPEYAPQGKLSGTIRTSGNDRMDGLLKRWERGFRKYHPDVRFVLSREGQQIVADSRIFIPLSADQAAAELRKLDTP